MAKRLIDTQSWNDRGSKPKLFPAVCRCGHKGKSQRPETYRCGFCYYGARAQSNRNRADKLEAQARKLREEAQEFQDRSDAFKAKHADCG